MEKNTIKLYGNKAYGIEVSKYGLETGYLDYRTLSKIVGDCILTNNLLDYVGYETWDLYAGNLQEDDYLEVFQYYHITHFGTSWDCVLTDVSLV